MNVGLNSDLREGWCIVMEEEVVMKTNGVIQCCPTGICQLVDHIWHPVFHHLTA